MRRYRNTKIVATLGPSTRTKRQIRALIMAGVDVFRLNFSHGEHSDKKSRVTAIRELEKELDRPVAIMADLQGPKLRIGEFKDGEIVAFGNYQQLLKQSNTFFNMVEIAKRTHGSNI